MAHSLYFYELGRSVLDIYVDAFNDDIAPIIVEHQVLDASHSTLQYLGQKSPVRNFSFKVYTGSVMALLKTYVGAGSIGIYTDDTGASGSYVLSDLKAKRMQALNYTDQWFDCTMKGVYQAASGSLYYSV
jgi:hypothetical protein